VAADHLLAGVALDLPGARAPEDHVALDVEHEHRVVANVVGHQPHQRHLALPLGLEPLAGAHVAHRRDDHVGAVDRHRAERDVGRELAAVPAPEPDLAFGAHRPDGRRRGVLGAVAGVGLAQAVRHQHLDRHAHQIGARPSGQ
jgi:hypothetical protein